MSIIVKGERHSGTNWLQHMMEHNFGNATRPMLLTYMHAGCKRAVQPTDPLRTGLPDSQFSCCTKHGYARARCVYRPMDDGQTVRVWVIAMRDVYAWLASMYRDSKTSLHSATQRTCGPARSPEVCGTSFHDFIRAPFPEYILGITRPALRGARLRPVDFRNFSMPLRASPVDLWCAKVTAAVALRAPKVLLRHSDLYGAKGLAALQRIAAGGLADGSAAGGRGVPAIPLAHGGGHVGLPPLNESASERTQSKYAHVFSRAAFVRARGDARERRWLASYSQADLEWVNSEVEWRCGARARAFGFEVLRSVRVREPAGSVGSC